MKYFVFIIPLFLIAPTAFSKFCEIEVGSSDAMQFDTKVILVGADCTKFKVNFSHNGKLPANVMGHNLVFVETAKYMSVVGKINVVAGMKNAYLAKSNDVLYKSKIIGGGEKDNFLLDLKKFTKGVDYTFFCSVPGHFSMMNGKFKIM